MISLFGSVFGFGLPAILAGIPLAAGLLVYIYRRQGIANREKIGTIFFLKDLAQPIVSRSRFVPPFRFFIELLLLLLLLLGSSDIYTERHDDKVALVIDNSFSMFMRSDGKASSQPLLSNVLSQARLELDSLSSSTLVEVYVTSPYFRSLTEGLSGIRAGTRALEDVQISYGTDNLEAALTRLSGDARFKTIKIFSDRQRALYSSNSNEEKDARFEFVAAARGLGQRPSNVALTSIAATEQNGRYQIGSHIGNFSNERNALSIELRGVTQGGNDSARLESRKLELDPMKEEDVQFEVEGRAYEGFEISIKVQNPNQDLIPEDNTAYVSVNASSKQLLLVSEFSEKDLGIKGLPVGGVSVIKPDAYEVRSADLQGATVLFHRIAPQELPDHDALFIMPPEGSALSAGSLIEEKLPITRWDASHPLLAYLNVPALQPSVLMPLATPGWSRTVINASAGPLVIAGETNGHRYAAIGVELFPFRGAKDPVISVLTLNLLKWIQQGALSSGYVSVGSQIDIGSDISRARYLDGSSLSIERQEGRPVIVPDKPGFIVLEGAASTVLASSFFSIMESNIAELPSVPLPERRVEISQRAENGGVSNFLAWILFLIILIDVLYSTRVFGFYPSMATPALKEVA